MARINGKDEPSADGRTVAKVLADLGWADGRVACELNGDILPRAQYAARTLCADDALEVVRFVGGG